MFKHITIVSVHGGADGHNAVNSIKVTMEQMPGSRGLLISARRPSNLTSDIDHVLVSSFDYYQYSLFMIHCLHKFIDTDFVLIVQEDGWALNGGNWRNEWLDYDYVGAPCHAARLGDAYSDRYTWEGNPAAIQVMNGGSPSEAAGSSRPRQNLASCTSSRQSISFF